MSAMAWAMFSYAALLAYLSRTAADARGPWRVVAVVFVCATALEIVRVLS